MDPEEVERVVGSISEKDVMSFARRKLWDQDVAVSAVGSIEGLLDYNRYVLSGSIYSPSCPVALPVLQENVGGKERCVAAEVLVTDLPCRIRNDMSRNA